jgi:predicted nucleic acid-binding Zn ribbon protein
MSDRRADDPMELRDALASVSRRLGLPEVGLYETVVEVWREVVGDEVATHARVRAVRGEECVVEADAPAWATRARYLGPELRRRVNERFGGTPLTRVTVVVRGA